MPRWRIAPDSAPAAEADVVAQPFDVMQLQVPITVPSQSGEHVLVAEVSHDGNRHGANRLTVVVP